MKLLGHCSALSVKLLQVLAHGMKLQASCFISYMKAKLYIFTFPKSYFNNIKFVPWSQSYNLVRFRCLLSVIFSAREPCSNRSWCTKSSGQIRRVVTGKASDLPQAPNQATVRITIHSFCCSDPNWDTVKGDTMIFIIFLRVVGWLLGAFICLILFDLYHTAKSGVLVFLLRVYRLGI